MEKQEIPQCDAQELLKCDAQELLKLLKEIAFLLKCSSQGRDQIPPGRAAAVTAVGIRDASDDFAEAG